MEQIVTSVPDDKPKNSTNKNKRSKKRNKSKLNGTAGEDLVPPVAESNGVSELSHQLKSIVITQNGHDDHSNEEKSSAKNRAILNCSANNKETADQQTEPLHHSQNTHSAAPICTKNSSRVTVEASPDISTENSELSETSIATPEKILSESKTELPLASQSSANIACTSEEVERTHIHYKVYESELEMPDIMRLIQKDLSEPYSVYTYRYFIHNWPKLCFLALHESKCVGAIVCKLDIHRQTIKRGYIAMLAVDKDYRKLKIGTTLVQKAIRVIYNLTFSLYIQ